MKKQNLEREFYLHMMHFITSHHHHHWENKNFAAFLHADTAIAKQDCG